VIEERIADRFRQAVLDEPPLGFDPDEVVDRARQRQRHRRAVGASALATVGVALAAVAVFAASGGGGAQLDVGAPGPSGSVAPPAVTPHEKVEPPPSAAPTFTGSDAVVAKLSQTISTVLAEKVPALRFTEPDGGTLMVVEGHRGLGGAYRADGTKHRYVSVFAYHEKDSLDLAGDVAAGGGWGPLVSDEVRQDGSHLRVYRTQVEGTGGIAVVHLRTDGMIVQVDTTAKPEPGQSGFAVTQETLISIATDARLTF
jgi:hypothetical protein